MIYLDNASTSHPKPSSMIKAMEEYNRNIGVSPGRGGYKLAENSNEILVQTKKRASALFNVHDLNTIHFCHNATHGLNLIIQGILEQNDHVVTSCLEHNSVLRPLKKLHLEKNVSTSIVSCTANGVVKPSDFESALQKNTKLIIITHASNLTGLVSPVEEIIKIAQKHKVLTLLDASQTAGVIPIDLEKLKPDYFVTTGHKGLKGPSGTGLLIARNKNFLNPLLVGGTGGNSFSLWHPRNWQKVFEAGTCNYLGLAGLNASLEHTLKNVHSTKTQNSVLEFFIEKVRSNPEIHLYGDAPSSRRVPLISFTLQGHSPTNVSQYLDQQHNILLRAGLLCAPLIHKSLGTFPEGVLRVSLNEDSTKKDMTTLYNALQELMKTP